MKVIITNDTELENCVEAYRRAIIYSLEHPEWRKDTIGIGINGKYYGVKWNKNSITVYPNN